MSYDEGTAARVRKLLTREKSGLLEIKMMGGLCFTLHGHMCCGVLNNDLVVRVGPEFYERALEDPHARPMDFTGRPLRGFVFVAPSGHTTGTKLALWINRATAFAKSLPAKPKPPMKKPKVKRLG